VKNKYYRRSHISESKFLRLLRYFAQDLSAADAACLTGLTRKTVNAIFLRLRQRIAQREEQKPMRAAKTVVPSAVNHGQPLSIDGNGIGSAMTDSSVTATMEHSAVTESFQEFVKERLRKFKGVTGRTLDLHLKECEWRYNRQHSDLYTELIDLLRDKPL
jgi:transposase-like protein